MFRHTLNTVLSYYKRPIQKYATSATRSNEPQRQLSLAITNHQMLTMITSKPAIKETSKENLKMQSYLVKDRKEWNIPTQKIIKLKG